MILLDALVKTITDLALGFAVLILIIAPLLYLEARLERDKLPDTEPQPEYEEVWAWPARNMPVGHAHMGKDQVPERRRAA